MPPSRSTTLDVAKEEPTTAPMDEDTKLPEHEVAKDLPATTFEAKPIGHHARIQSIATESIAETASEAATPPPRSVTPSDDTDVTPLDMEGDDPMEDIQST